MATFEIPPSIVTDYEKLYDLCENQSQYGVLLPKQVAEFLNKDTEWLLRTIYNGKCPFAFGSNVNVARGTSVIHRLPFFMFMTQGVIR